MSIIHHYIIVRADLSLGEALAQCTHAAGESARLSPELPLDTHAVVLHAKSEEALLKLEQRLLDHNIPHSAIREPDEPYCGAITAIGIAPCDRTFVRKLISNFPLAR